MLSILTNNIKQVLYSNTLLSSNSFAAILSYQVAPLQQYTLIMSLEPMPFLSGPTPNSSGPCGRNDPPSDVVSMIPLSKAQQALWLDYLVRPHACHYHLRLEVDLTHLHPTLERLLDG